MVRKIRAHLTKERNLTGLTFRVPERERERERERARERENNTGVNPGGLTGCDPGPNIVDFPRAGLPYGQDLQGLRWLGRYSQFGATEQSPPRRGDRTIQRIRPPAGPPPNKKREVVEKLTRLVLAESLDILNAGLPWHFVT